MSRTQVLTDEMWARIEPLLPPLKGPMGKTMRPHRPLVEVSIFRLRAGLAWRDLPAEFGPWQTVWKRHAKFSKDGTWDKVLLALQTQADAAGEIDWNVSVDSTVARVHQHGATAARSQLTVTAHTGGSIELQSFGKLRGRTGRSRHWALPGWPDDQDPCARRWPRIAARAGPHDRQCW